MEQISDSTRSGSSLCVQHTSGTRKKCSIREKDIDAPSGVEDLLDHFEDPL